MKFLVVVHIQNGFYTFNPSKRALTINSVNTLCPRFSQYMTAFFNFLLFAVVMEDACMWEFTPGQIDKMERDVKQYRPTLMKNIYSKEHAL